MPYMQSKRMDVKISPFSRASANLTAQGFDACWPLLQLPIQLCRCDVLTVFFLMKIYCFFKFGRFSPCKSKKRKDQKTLQTKETEGTVSLPQFAHSSAALILHKKTEKSISSSIRKGIKRRRPSCPGRKGRR